MMLKAIRDRLLATAAVTGGLASYNFGPPEGSLAGVFTCDPAPGDAATPLIVLTLEAGPPWGTRDAKGGEAGFQVRLIGSRGESTASLRDTAWAIWYAVERADLSIVGYEEVGVRVNTPGQITDQDGFPMFVIDGSVRFLEE